jgi:ppGpp synthetase/RelA/SpoT-type nucleotidyltranferase
MRRLPRTNGRGEEDLAIPANVIKEAVDRYGRERDRYLKLAARVADLATTGIVEKNAIRAQVTSRTKTIRSFEGKLNRFAKSGKKNFTTVNEVFEGIGDFAGVRIATYRPEDQEMVRDEICRVFRDPSGGEVVPDPKDAIDFKVAKFYRAIHFQVCLPEEELVGDYDNLEGTSCEIQVCSMMAHVWNEIEHDIAYKPEGSGPETVEKGLLASLGHLTCSGDAIITRLLEATELRLEQQTGDFVDVHDFVARLRSSFPELELSINAGIAFEISQLLELTNPGRVFNAAGAVRTDIAAVRARLQEFNAYLQNLGSSELQLNGRSADVLSVALLDRNTPAVAAAVEDRKGSRPTRAAGLARRYRDFLALEAGETADASGDQA